MRRFRSPGLGVLGLGFLLAAVANPPVRGADERPNIVVFIADDAGWSDFGAYGNRVVRTPNLDDLAASGVVFENAFLTTASCSPSRISILSGRYPHATGAEDLHTPLPAGVDLLPAYLGREGYFTGHMRKTHYGPEGERQFDWFSEETWEGLPGFLDEAGERPFFLWVGFRDPHRPYSADAVDSPHDPAKVAVPPYLVDDEATRADLALYYDEISRMDGEIGRMLAELDRRDLREDTLVVFLSDNGMPFPRAKATAYDAGIRTPLIVSWPGVTPAGARYPGLTTVIDLAPTLLDAAGASAPGELPRHELPCGAPGPGLAGARLRVRGAQLAQLRRAHPRGARPALQADPERLHRVAALHAGRCLAQPVLVQPDRGPCGRDLDAGSGAVVRGPAAGDRGL